MKIAIIQSGNAGFFPRFYKDLTDAIKNNGGEYALFNPNTGRNKKTPLSNQIIFGSRFNWFIHFYLYKLLGIQDIYSVLSTLDLIHKLKKFQPDVINLHIANACFLNFPLLIRFLNKHSIPAVWTLHDCRAFTGRCAYFDEINCDRWKVGCGHCPQTELYSPSLFDNTHLQWVVRNKIYHKWKNLTIVTPSQWLSSYVKLSYFSDRKVEVIYNGIDIAKFAEKQTCQYPELYNSNKKMILGVSASWEYRKGLSFFSRLADDLNDDFNVVIVGPLDENQKMGLSKNLICLPRTDSLKKLVGLYQKADVFVNPTLADNFPTTNIEALAAGTPVVTFLTGGSAEAIDETCGIAVPKGDYEALKNAIGTVAQSNDKYSRDNCMKRALRFSKSQYCLYYNLFQSLLK